MEYESTVEWFNRSIDENRAAKLNVNIVDGDNRMISSTVQVGDVVQCINMGLESYNQIGIVTALPCNKAIVLFENWKGLGPKELTFRRDNIKIKEKGENNMAVTGNYDIAIVKFIQGYDTSKEYAFALFERCLPGTHVLCDTKNGCQVGKIQRIENKSEFTGALPTAEIICKVDFSAFESRKAARAERKRLKKEMDRLIAEDRELVLYQALAEKSPAMAELLNAYKELDGVG